MAGGRERFLAEARGAGVDPEVRTFPDGTRTAQDAAAAVGCELDQIVKSLVFVVDERPVLALTAGGNRVDTARLAAAVGGTDARKADADEVRAATGYAIGGTPPFGHPEPLPTVVDPRLLDFDQVWAAAGTPMDVFPLRPERLVELAGATVEDVTAR